MAAVDGNGASALPRARKARAVLAILALSADAIVLRSDITGLLWSLREKEQAHASLRQAVHELQEVLGAGVLRADRNHLSFQGARPWVDAAAFLLATPSKPEPLALYAPTLLEDLRGLDPAFDQWIGAQRQRLARAARQLAETILAEQRDPAGRCDAAERLLAIDPAHEAAWRALITAQVEQGDDAAALAAYERCQAALAQAGITAPAPETRALAEQILAAVPARAGPPLPAPAIARRDGAVEPSAGVRLGVVPLRPVQPGDDANLALALTAEITAALAKFRWMACVALCAVTDQAAPEMDFLLDGTIQRSGSRIRMIVRLSDMRVGRRVVWTHRFDREVADVFALQDEIAAITAAQIDAALLLWEAQRTHLLRGGDLSAKELMLRAIPSLCRLERGWFHKAGGMLEEAVERDPANASAHAWLAHWHMFLVGQGWAPDPQAAIVRAGVLAEQAVRLDSADARAVTLAGHVRGFLHRRLDEAQVLHERALALNPNLALAWCLSGLGHSYLGQHVEALRRIDHAQRLSPHDPHAFFFDTAQIMPHLLVGAFARAAEIGRRATALNPGFTSALKGRLAALGHLGRDAEAADVRARLLALEPGFSLRAAAERAAMARDEDIALYVAGLRKAGLPE